MVIARALLGLAFFCAVSWLMSSDRRRVEPRIVVLGILMQVLLAVVILKTGPGRVALDAVSKFATTVLGFGNAGANMVFGDVLTGFATVPEVPKGAPPEPITLYDSYPFQLGAETLRSTGIVSFAFKALPTILYFSAVMAILYHFGVMQRLIRGLAWVMQRTLRTSGAESMAVAATNASARMTGFMSGPPVTPSKRRHGASVAGLCRRVGGLVHCHRRQTASGR